MNSIYIKEQYHGALNCLYKGVVMRVGLRYDVTIYMDGYVLEVGQVFDFPIDAVVYVVLKLAELCDLYTKHRF